MINYYLFKLSLFLKYLSVFFVVALNVVGYTLMKLNHYLWIDALQYAISALFLVIIFSLIGDCFKFKILQPNLITYLEDNLLEYLILAKSENKWLIQQDDKYFNLEFALIKGSTIVSLIPLVTDAKVSIYDKRGNVKSTNLSMIDGWTKPIIDSK